MRCAVGPGISGRSTDTLLSIHHTALAYVSPKMIRSPVDSGAMLQSRGHQHTLAPRLHHSRLLRIAPRLSARQPRVPTGRRGRAWRSVAMHAHTECALGAIRTSWTGSSAAGPRGTP